MHMETPPAPTANADARSSFLEEKAFKSRTVLVFGAITDQSAADTVRRLIALDAFSSRNELRASACVAGVGGVSMCIC